MFDLTSAGGVPKRRWQQGRAAPVYITPCGRRKIKTFFNFTQTRGKLARHGKIRVEICSANTVFNAHGFGAVPADSIACSTVINRPDDPR